MYRTVKYVSRREALEHGSRPRFKAKRDGYTDLIECVIKQALKDYCELRLGQKFPTKFCNEKEIELFFKSKTYTDYCPMIDGDTFLNAVADERDCKLVLERIKNYETVRWKEWEREGLRSI